MLELANLTKKYANKTAVHNVSFGVQPGLVTGFLGPNGAGKTTTIRMILSLAAPTSGCVCIDGKPFSTQDAPLKKIGAMVDSNAIDSRLTPWQYLDILATASGIRHRKVEELLHFVGLAHVPNKRIGAFSFGMRQRVGIAAALLGEPETIIMDEPFNGLDVDGIHWLRALLTDLAREGRAVLVSSHLLSEVQEIADRIVVLARGELIADMSMDEMRARSASTYVQVRASDTAKLQEILQANGAQADMVEPGVLRIRKADAHSVGDMAFENGLRIYELTCHQPSLEQLFTELVDGKSEYAGESQHRDGKEPKQ